MKFILLAIVFFTMPSQAFVSGPSVVEEGENALTLGTQLELGKVKPTKGTESHQDASINIHKLRLTRGLKGLSELSRSNVFVEYGHLNSAEEKIGATQFYKSDRGHYVTLGGYLDLYRDLDQLVGVYIQLNPLRQYNKSKFSNPRVDIFSAGVTSAVKLNDQWFQKNLLHYGSGDGSQQNSYLAVDTGFGYKMNEWIGKPLTIAGSLFMESDLESRVDPNYGATFSPSGNAERIRTQKIGTHLAADYALSETTSLTATYLQKIAGSYLRSTRIYTLNLSIKF